MNRDGAETVTAAPFTGHRHSHPGAVLSYGPPPPPPPPPAPAPPPPAPAPLPQPPSHAVDPTAVNNYATLAPTLAMHNFIHHFTQHFQAYPPALIAFRNLGANYTTGSLSTEQFYVGVYQLLYRTQATELMAEFGQFRPTHWRDEDLGWYHRAIEGRFDQELAQQARTREWGDAVARQQQQQQMQTMVSNPPPGAMERRDMGAGLAIGTSLALFGTGQRGLGMEASRRRLVVRLKVGSASLRALAQTGSMMSKARQGGGMGRVFAQPPTSEPRGVPETDNGGKLIPLSMLTPPASVLNRRVPPPLSQSVLASMQKKVPVNGFRASGGMTVPSNRALETVTEEQQGEHEAEAADRVDEDGPQNEDGAVGQLEPVHGQPKMGSPAPLSELESYFAATHGEENVYEDESTEAIAATLRDRQAQSDEIATNNAAEPAQLDGTADHDELQSSPDSSPPALHPESHTHAADHDHIGPIYPTRRAILARTEKPYIHLACGQGYPHPQDVSGHHKTCSAVRGRSKKANDYVERNAHESCRIGYPELKYTKVVEGYVVLERESVEKIERAVESGLAFLRAQREEGAVGEEVVGAEVEKRVGRKGPGKRRGEGEGLTRPPPPKRQYVRAGPD
ncbi:hypothetical protein LTS16_001749 [Friedmanniomyces endolithicus]|uniref:Uncharacterized protein n=1 Tax=Friedmanniomyces endolithicus TaxID=329885 RepID=A0AAN6G0N5_9PEZI|nr:hypothetical protein LTR82_001426 [Friedmanniomyces endolithicus]KAK1052681.1 hypothetical protein LTS16_001749 [Friedmanniomyces endolithicus]